MLRAKQAAVCLQLSQYGKATFKVLEIWNLLCNDTVGAMASIYHSLHRHDRVTLSAPRCILPLCPVQHKTTALQLPAVLGQAK